jgi:hypothetical protein
MHSLDIDEHSQRREDSERKNTQDVLFNPVRAKYDRSPIGGFHREDDPWTPRPTVTEHDHCLLRSQATSREATDDGKKIHGRELTLVVPRCQHSQHRSLRVPARLDSRGKRQRFLEPTCQMPPPSRHTAAGAPGNMGAATVMACATCC